MGAPKGNQNGRRGADFRAALKVALDGYEDDPRGIRRGDALLAIAKQLVADALSPDADIRLDARKELADRIDGKPKQALVGGDDDDAPLRFAIERIELVDLKSDSGSGSPTA